MLGIACEASASRPEEKDNSVQSWLACRVPYALLVAGDTEFIVADGVWCPPGFASSHGLKPEALMAVL